MGRKINAASTECGSLTGHEEGKVDIFYPLDVRFTCKLMKTVKIYRLVALAEEGGSGNVLEAKTASRHQFKLAAHALNEQDRGGTAGVPPVQRSNTDAGLNAEARRRVATRQRSHHRFDRLFVGAVSPAWVRTNPFQLQRNRGVAAAAVSYGRRETAT